jgi:hypothetical protein
MRVEMRDAKTIIITPENTAEMVALQKFEGAKLSIEKPAPMQPNVDSIKIQREE